MAEKCDYIVSNTIVIDQAFRRVIANDLHKRHGRYTYLYPTSIKTGMNMSIAMVTESVATMSTDTP